MKDDDDERVGWTPYVYDEKPEPHYLDTWGFQLDRAGWCLFATFAFGLCLWACLDCFGVPGVPPMP